MSDNWIVQNLENALKTWNDKLSEIWQLITQSPEQFKGGSIWNVIVQHCAGFNINHYERRRFRLGYTDGIAAGDCYGC